MLEDIEDDDNELGIYQKLLEQKNKEEKEG